MNKTYITALVLVLVVLGGVSFFFNNKKLEAPSHMGTMHNDDNADSISAVEPTNPNPTTVTTGVACTMDAKMCPDGSYVGRTGPKCEFSACPASATDSKASVKEFTVKGQNFSFAPSMITVKKGDKVKITFENTSGYHDFKIDEYGVATKQTQAPSTEVLEFTADKAGSFEYYCSVGQHRSMGMKGTLKVE